MRFLLTAVVLLLGASHVASQESPRPASEQTEKSTAEQTPASAFEGPGKPIPFWFTPRPQVIQVVSEKKAEPSCEVPEGYGSGKLVSFFWCELRAYPEAIAAGSTLLLTFATFLLAISTQIAAKAAKSAAKHILRVERAYMFGGPADNGTKFDDPINTVRVVINVKNYGKTPGVLIETYGEFLPNAPTVRPSRYSFTAGNKWDYDNLYGQGDDKVLDNHPFEGVKHPTIYFIGYIKYRTVIDDRIRTSYWCVKPRRVSNVKEEWAIVAAPGWNGSD